jgi:hypothetical protein
MLLGMLKIAFGKCFSEIDIEELLYAKVAKLYG